MSKQISTTPKQAAKPRRTYLLRLYPTRKQTRTLERWLGLCCELYNAALEERRSVYHMAGLSLSYEHQCAELLACKTVRPDLAEVPAQVLHRPINGTPKTSIVKRTPTGKWFVVISNEWAEDERLVEWWCASKQPTRARRVLPVGIARRCRSPCGSTSVPTVASCSTATTTGASIS